jgi:predicted RNA-binding protein with PIN domain
MSRFWIVDGHNVIFAIPRLKTLQLSGRGEEAREGLLAALRRFTQARKARLLVVFDGADVPSNQDVTREPLLEVVYSPRHPGGADERIIRGAKSLVQQGHRVTVVTNDVITLAALLPKDVDHLKVRPFWEKHVEEVEGSADKRVEGDFSDVEKEMLTRAATAEPVQVITRPAAAPTPGRPDHGAAKSTLRERLRLKREKGKARHRRRFKRL